jgi:hypothetical protein
MQGTDETRIVHESPFTDWFVTQDMPRGVSLCDRNSNEKIVVEPPAEWGRGWRWNLTEDGTGIYFRRNAEPSESGRATEGSEHARDQ